MNKKVAILGASGFAGAELIRILLQHPFFDVDVVVSDSFAGQTVASLYPAFTGKTALEFSSYKDVDFDAIDVAFLAVPHTASLKMSPELLKKGISVIDLSADFRLKDPAIYEQYYDVSHTEVELLKNSFFGQPELWAEEIKAAAKAYSSGNPVLVACAGCYPTATSLAAAPAVYAGLTQPNTTAIVDAISGVSGAGRTPSARTHFCTANNNLSVYGLLKHRHTPEMEQLLKHEHPVLFTPHLAPLNRGLLSTVTMQANKEKPISTESLQKLYADYYANSSFVQVLCAGEMPQTSAVEGTNNAQVSVSYSERTNTILAIGAIDNLCKGASGQAVQCANIVFGFEENTGLTGLALPV